MKNRMGLPQEYEPVLPGRLKAYLEKKRRQHEKQTAKDVYVIQGTETKRIKIGVSHDVVNVPKPKDLGLLRVHQTTLIV